MKKLFRTLLPAGLLTLAASVMFAQADQKLQTVQGVSTAEKTATAPVRGYTPPRAKSGIGSFTTFARPGQKLSYVSSSAPADGPAREYIEYVPEIRGMVWTDSSTGLNMVGLDGSLTPIPQISLNAMMGVPGGGYGKDGKYYTTVKYEYPGFNIYYAFCYDLETLVMDAGWPAQLSQELMSTDLTYDPSDGEVYGCFTNSTADGYEFCTVDFLEGRRTVITALPAAWNAIAADKDGNMYAIDMEGQLLSVNKTTGETEVIGQTGYTPLNISSATFDNKTGKLYWTVSTDSEGFLCEVDTETGAATKIADFAQADEVYGLYILPPDAEDRAPAAPTNLSLEFTNDSLTGHLVFDAPATLFRGEEGTGDVDYRVVLNGETITSGTTTYGATAVATPDFTVSAPGRYTFTLICSNAEGDSPKAEISRFIGADAPAAVTGAHAEYADGVFTVTWNAPLSSANGGYINPDEVTYTVTRNPDGYIAAQATKQTTVTDPVAEPESYVKYNYTIVAEYAGCKSYAVTTNGVGLGSIVPPYNDDFSDALYTESYTTIDANGDGRCWAAFIGMAQGLGPVYGSTETTADDWLITPAIKLEGGKFYKFGISAATMGASWTETFEVKLGTAPTVEAMTDEIIPTTEVNTTGFMSTVPFEEYFTVSEDGIYYLGMHYNTAEGAYMLLLDNLSISEPIDAMSPDAVSDLVISPAEDGQKSALVEFTAPSTDLQGEPLLFLDRIEIMVDGELAKSVTGIEPGQQISETVTVAKSGVHKFTVTACNGETAGRPTEMEVHVGLNVPATPGNVKSVKTADGCGFQITWDAVTTDIDGKTIPASELSYLIMRLDGGQQIAIAQGLTDTQYTHVALTDADADQEFFQYAVFAQGEAGYSTGNVTEMIPLGAPDGMPWRESFSDGMLEHIMAAASLTPNGAWTIFGDQSFSMGVKSYDGDNGMLGMMGQNIGDAAQIFTGNIDFSGMEHPVMTFYTFNLKSSETGAADMNPIRILANTGDGNGFQIVKEMVVDEIGNGIRGWSRAMVDLTPLAGKQAQIAFESEIVTYLYTLIDVVEIRDCKNTDLAITESSSPKAVQLDSPFDITANIENIGLQPVEGYTVALYKNDKKIDETSGDALASFESAQVSFNLTMNASDEDLSTFRIDVACAGDEIADNNTSGELTVRLKRYDFPPVRDLEATCSADNSVRLSWATPEEMTDDDEEYTETFEDAETEDVFPTEYGNWTFADEDGGYIGGMRGVELPGIQTGSQQSFWVMDAAHPVFGGNTSYTAHSGTKYLAQMYTMSLNATEPVPCDDWIISPLLNEKEQTVSFFCRSYGGDDTHERFQFLYSTTGSSPEDFIQIETVPNVPNGWTEYTFTVPAGAKHFAIRCTSTFEFMFFVDDITYTPANGSNVKLNGYNVYVDGVKANDEPVTETNYTVENQASADDMTRYSVSAVYTHGESRGVHVYGAQNAVESVTTGFYAFGGKGMITLSADGEDVTIWSADGLKEFSGHVNGAKTVNVRPGVYLVRASHMTLKVIVR